jgi:predicted transcriptional regulator
MAKNKKIFDVIFREKPVMMLVELRNAGTQNPMYASTLAKKVDCTYSHVVKILQEMNKSGIVAFQKQGRLKILTLTKKGGEIAENLDKVRTTL